VGDDVGDDVVGLVVGDAVGDAVVGLVVGEVVERNSVGDAVGELVVGESVLMRLHTTLRVAHPVLVLHAPMLRVTVEPGEY
jgi:hypothetical protein